MGDRYWKAVAGAGIVVAAVYVFGVCRPFVPTPVAALSGEIVSVAPSGRNSNALYVIDTSKKVLLIYMGRGNTLNGFSLVYGRNIEPDAVLAQTATSMEFKPTGYSSKLVRDLLDKAP